MKNLLLTLKNQEAKLQNVNTPIEELFDIEDKITELKHKIKLETEKVNTMKVELRTLCSKVTIYSEYVITEMEKNIEECVSTSDIFICKQQIKYALNEQLKEEKAKMEQTKTEITKTEKVFELKKNDVIFTLEDMRKVYNENGQPFEMRTNSETQSAIVKCNGKYVLYTNIMVRNGNTFSTKEGVSEIRTFNNWGSCVSVFNRGL